MHYLIYMSRAAVPLPAAALVDLLRQAQAANREAGITGLLVYHEGRFMQVLEGEQAAVMATYGRILRDPRHREVHKLTERKIAARSFPVWSMAFQETDRLRFDQLIQLAGYLDPAQLHEALPGPTTPDALLLNRLRDFILPRHAPLV